MSEHHSFMNQPFSIPWLGDKLSRGPSIFQIAATLTLLTLWGLPAGPATAAGADEPVAVEADGLAFDSWSDFLGSEYFKAAGLRCGTPDKAMRALLYPAKGGDPSDCSANSTNPTADYDPAVLYEIPVVVHILMDSSCAQGVISDALVDSQIDILNEDLLALIGTNGGNGTDAQIRFVLASEDPGGAPTTGVTRDCNSTWFNDSGSYWNTLAWDPDRYLNIYTNQAGGNLGYVPFLPADAGGSLVGSAADRVVILWSSFGRNGPIGPPYDQGRTSTHEVGHYLGLEHTFNPESSCGSAMPPGCYSDGDMICDTNVEQSPGSSPCFVGASSSCGSVDPTDNYMDYSDDLCMERFSLEQIRRTRCSLEFYRPNVYRIVGSAAPQVTITAPADGASFPAGTSIAFAGTATDAEDGDLTAGLGWTSNLDGNLGSGGSFSATLSAGTHTVTAAVTDSGGLQGSSSITVTVTASCEGGGGLDEDFEGGAGAWTTSGLWHLVNDSSCASPGYSSPVRSMYYGRDASCDYDTGNTTDGNLISPQVSGLTASSS
ncbi:MAG: M43 family zinc metalloprotease, partial [Thermoanaerobaculia bacterium]